MVCKLSHVQVKPALLPSLRGIVRKGESRGVERLLWPEMTRTSGRDRWDKDGGGGGGRLRVLPRSCRNRIAELHTTEATSVNDVLATMVDLLCMRRFWVVGCM